MIVAVTGAAGHVGTNLVRALLERGRQVRAVVHRDARALEGLQVQRVEADVLDEESLVAAFSGIDVVFHLAAHVSIMEEAEILERVNTQGTRNVVAACLRCGVRRLVYTSSIEALLRPDKGDPVDESGPPRPELSATRYGRSKALAELEVLSGVERGLDAVIAYPTAVVGAFDFKPSFFGQFFLDFGRMKVPALVPGGFDLVDARDVAAGLLAAAEKGRRGEGYILSGGYLTVSEIAAIAEESSGVPRPRLVVPFWLARPAAVLAPRYYRLARRRPRFTPMALKVLHDGRRPSCQKAREELGYAPRTPAEGIRAAFDWFKESGRLPGRNAVFRSHLSAGLAAAVGLILLVCIAGGFFLLGAEARGDVALGAACLAASALYLWLTVPVRYQITGEELLVRGGPFRWRIPLDSILEARPSKNPLSAPSWSLRRLHIRYRKKGKTSFVLISPSDRAAFMRKLCEHHPGLRLHGQRLSRSDTGDANSS